MRTVGLLAGNGRLPVVFAQAVRHRGWQLIACGVTPDVEPELAGAAHAYSAIPITHWGQVVEYFRAAGVAELVLLGKVPKATMFERTDFDARCLTVLARLREKNDDALILAFVADLAAEGIQVVDQTALLPELLPGAGLLSQRGPTAGEAADIEYGFRMAKSIAGLDIGQTVIVKSGAVIAIEAIEGTDAAIARAGTLAGAGAVVVKVAKPNQDVRFDVPTIGLETLESARRAGVTAIAFEAERTLVVDPERVAAAADELGLCLVGTRDGRPPYTSEVG